MRRVIIVMTTILLTACHEDIIENPDCEKLMQGIVENNELVVKTEIEKLTADLPPQPAAEDETGHYNNLLLLTERLNDKCSGIIATTECYACIETYPPISEILLEFDYEGNKRSTLIDLYTSDKDILRYAGMHIYLEGE